MSAAMETGTYNLVVARALQQGLRLVEAGYYLTPVTITRTEKGDKLARFHAKWRTDGGWTSDPAQIRDWSAQFSCSFAIVCGPSGVEGVDLDVKPDRGVDAVAWWANEGLPLGLLVVGTPSGGMHTYWRRPRTGRRLPTSAGEVAPGVDTRSIGGLFFAPGAFVLDIEGNPEEVGYTVQGPLVPVDELTVTPEEVLDAWAPPAPELKETPAGSPDPDRRYTDDQAAEWVKRYGIDPLKNAAEGGRNNALNTAAVVTGHFVPEFYTEEEATEALTRIAEKLELDPREIGPTIRSGLRAGMAEPYVRVEADPFASASGSSASDPDAFELAVATKIRELRIADEARRRFARDQRAHRPNISEGVLDDLDAIPEPVMLLGSLIPDQAVGFLAGRSGAYKSFLATAWACCIATGRPWLGRPEFSVQRPLKVLYVAAEGAGGAAGRIRAWEAANETSRRGKLLLYPRPIHLNDPAQVEELTEYVISHGIQFLVIDTYHRSAPGTEENSSTDFGTVFEAVATLRDEHDCSALFVDHTGAGKAGVPRGTSAKRDDADYILSTTYQGEEATSETQRELFVTKLKDEDTGGRWAIKLTPVEGQRFPVVDLGIVGDGSPFAEIGQWWTAENCPRIPEDVLEMLEKEVVKRNGKGREAARWIWRLLASIDDEVGLTNAEIRRMLAAAPPAEKLTEEMVKRGLVVLTSAGLTWRDGAKIGLEVRP
jgi:hypothetical protein